MPVPSQVSPQESFRRIHEFGSFVSIHTTINAEMRRPLGVSSLLTVAWLLISTVSFQITTVNNTHDLICTEPRQTSDRLAQTIAQGIASTSAVANACSASLQHNSTDGPNTILKHPRIK